MGLITKDVEVKLGVRNIKYYENLGYIIPKYKNANGKLCVKKGTTINVKIDDLSQGSNVEVEYECDMCKKIIKTRYDVYSKHNNNGITYCISCSGVISSSKLLTNVFKCKSLKNKSSQPKYIEKKEESLKTQKQQNVKRKYGSYWNRPIDTEYTDFVKKVLARDVYKCQCCGISNDLVVHHLDGYNWCIEKRTDATNGITLCDTCHKNFHLNFGSGGNTKEQYEQWIGKAIGELEKYNGKLPTARKVYCIEEDKTYNSTTHVMEEWGLKGNAEIFKMCSHYPNVKSVRGKHLLWLDEYETMSQEDVTKYLENLKPNYCSRKRKNTDKSDALAS